MCNLLSIATGPMSSVQLLGHVRLFVTPWTAEWQASLFITNSQGLVKLMSIDSVMPSKHLILCHPLLLPSVFPIIRVLFLLLLLFVFFPKSQFFVSGAKVLEFQLQHQSL